jgi:hypothetical protein
MPSFSYLTSLVVAFLPGMLSGAESDDQASFSRGMTLTVAERARADSDFHVLD